MRLYYPFDLPTLPYSFDSMLPYMSEWTMKTHYECNHEGYVKKANALLETASKDFKKSKLALLLTKVKGETFDNVAQHFNHVLWWYSMMPPNNSLSIPMMPRPQGNLLHLITRDFGSLENWKKDFITKALTQFGSGWCWLVLEDGKLANHVTPNAQLPNFYSGRIPLLVCDLWEHSYFCDYQTARQKYVEGWMYCINWHMANMRLEGDDPIFTLY